MKSNYGYYALKHANQEHEERFMVLWNFFSVCNYSCSYCEPEVYDGAFKGVEFDKVKNFIDNVFEQRKDKKVGFIFQGGEVTLYPQLYALGKHIKSHGGDISILSNGSRKLKWWIKNVDILDQVVLSYHHEFADQIHFTEVAKFLSSRTNVHVHIMIDPDNFDEIKQFATKLMTDVEGLSVALQPLFKGFTGAIYPYSQEQMGYLLKKDGKKLNLLNQSSSQLTFRGEMIKVKENPDDNEVVNQYDLITLRENSWFGWHCHAGVENIYVTKDGSVRRGTCTVGGLIGWVQDKEINLPTESIVCTKVKCSCAFDVTTTKYMYESEK